MKKLIAIILILLSLPVTAQGDMDYLEKSQPAPYNGYLITPEREKKFRLMDKELEVQKSIVAGQEQLNIHQEEQINALIKRNTLYREENAALAETLAKKNSNTFWENTLFFVLGVAITGGLAVGLSKAL